MLKNFKKIVLGVVILSIFISFYSLNSMATNGEAPVDVPGDTIQTRIQAGNRTQLQFRERTRLTFNCNVSIALNVSCEAMKIGTKDFEIEINAENELQMNMTCTEEQIQLGLQKGHTYQVRNRNRFRFEEGFCVSIQCNDSCQAKLKLEANNRNQNAKWAYYDESTEEWVTMPTSLQNGYLVCETNHFSTWTVLIPESEDFTMIYIIVGVIVGLVVIIGIAIYLKKRK
ncbi:MAG: hypothetical protein ACFFB0_10640 [Promethearchaeota archaeon]